MAKPSKTTWASGDPSYRIEPGAGKKSVGWLSGEKPPFQYFNWLHYNYLLWEDYFEAKTETISPTMLVSSGTATWNGGTGELVLSQPLDVSFRVTTGEQINRIPAGTYTLSAGQVFVLKKDKTNPSPVTVTNGTYGTLGSAQYAIVSENALTANDQENETILFRMRGTDLECPINGNIWESGVTIDFGKASGVITDHGALSGLADDDHPQYAQIAGSETISGLWNYTTIPTASANPTTSTQLARKAYVDSVVVTDHGALTGLSDNDHPQYGLVASNNTWGGTQTFSNVPSVPDDSWTFAKIENVAQNRILGRVSSGTGNIEELTASQVANLIQSSIDLIGDQSTSGDGGFAFLFGSATYTNPTTPTLISFTVPQNTITLAELYWTRLQSNSGSPPYTTTTTGKAQYSIERGTGNPIVTFMSGDTPGGNDPTMSNSGSSVVVTCSTPVGTTSKSSAGVKYFTKEFS